MIVKRKLLIILTLFLQLSINGDEKVINDLIDEVEQNKIVEESSKSLNYNQNQIPSGKITKLQYVNPFPEQHPTAKSVYVWMSITELGSIEARIYYTCDSKFFKEQEAVSTIFYVAESYKIRKGYTRNWRVQQLPRLTFFTQNDIQYSKYRIDVLFLK